MPTYDYECTQCGHTFEAFQNMSDEPLKKCPECGKKVRRLIGGGVGIIFKGSGFYVTDNKSGGKNGSETNGEKTTAKETASAKSEGKDSKPAGDSSKSGSSKSSDKKTA